MYYLDKQFKSQYRTGYISYENGPYDGRYFSSYEEAEGYAIINATRLDANEALAIIREEVKR